MSKKIDSILKEILPKVSPSKEEYSNMKSLLNEFLKKINYEIKKQKISVQIFVGGSFAKKTLTKKDKYDADVFARFDKKYEEKELSNILKKII
jgi:tRNA nucleotidyltransferase (CCA-adding enzyme)